MFWIVKSLLNKAWLYIAAAGALLGALAAAYTKGSADAREKAAKQALEDYKDTRERMDAVDTPSDTDTARDWLRKRSRK